MRVSTFAVLALVVLTGCGESLNNAISLGGLGGTSGGPGTINPSEVLSMGQDLYKAATLSDEEVKKLGQESIAEMDRLNKVAGPNDPYSKRLNKLAATLHNEDGLQLNYKVYLTRDVNAFSLPDGSIRVFSALMDRFNDDELRFILGHEIGHVKNGHRKARMQRAYVTSAAAKAASAGIKAGTSSNIGGVAAVIGGDIASQLASEVINGQFSQGDETESDEYGLKLLEKYQHPKEAAVTALIKLNDLDGRAASKTDLFTSLTSSHPEPLDRARHIQSLVPELAAMPDMTEGKIQVAKKDVANTSGSDHPQTVAANLKPSQGAPAKAVLPASDVALSQSGSSSSDKGAATNRVAVKAAQDQDTSPHLSPAGWYIQVGAFSSHDAADKLKTGLSQSTKAVSTHSTLVSGQPVYRVIVGPFGSRIDAERRLHTIRSKEHQTPDAFVRHIQAES
jgi:putative metalloprotease